MKHLILYSLMILFFSCEKEVVEIPIIKKKLRDSFLIVDNTNNCNHISYDSRQIQSGKDSIDLNFDDYNDLEFLLEYVYTDNCEEFYKNCPPEVICDCWPRVETQFYISLPKNIEILVDSIGKIKKLNPKDTISNEGYWTNNEKFLIAKEESTMRGFSIKSEYSIGLRTINNEDTIISYIGLKYEYLNVLIKNITTQK